MHFIFTTLIITYSLCNQAMSLETNMVEEYTGSEKNIIMELKGGILNTDLIQPQTSTGTITDNIAKGALDVMNDTKRTFNPSYKKKGSLNNNLTLFRDTDQIITLNMSTNDAIDANICFQSPIRILLGNSITDSISQAISDDPNSIDAAVLKDERSIFVLMKKEMKAEGSIYRTRVRIIRKSDNRSYIINLNAQACPGAGRFGFPSELIIEERSQSSADENDRIRTPEDLILGLTNGLPRKNLENQIELYGGAMSPGSDYAMIAVSVKIGNTTRGNFYPQFYVLDSLQSRVLGMQEPIYLEKESRAVTERIGHPILRFNLFLKINKKYIIERDSIHLIMIENGEKYYQKVRIPTSALRDRLINYGYDLN